MIYLDKNKTILASHKFSNMTNDKYCQNSLNIRPSLTLNVLVGEQKK